MLKETMSLENLHDLLEVALVDAHNARVVSKVMEEEAKRRRGDG